MGGEIRINCSWITVFAAYYFYRSDVAFSFGTGVFLSTMVDAVPIIHGFSWRTFYMELSMTPFKQKIMAAAAFDEPLANKTAQMVVSEIEAAAWADNWSVHKSLPTVVERLRWHHSRTLPLLTRLVDEVEALKAALDKIHDTDFAASVHMPIIAEEALETHQKRWEDLK